MAIKLADTLAPMADFPAAMAEHIDFSDGKSLQEKYDLGELGGEGGAGHIELTQAEYDALSDEEKNNGAIYFITDAIGEGGDASIDDNNISSESTWSSAKIVTEISDNYAIFEGVVGDSYYSTTIDEEDITNTPTTLYGGWTLDRVDTNLTAGSIFSAFNNATKKKVLSLTEEVRIGEVYSDSFSVYDDTMNNGGKPYKVALLWSNNGTGGDENIKTYTSLAQMGLTADATIDDVRNALKVGETCMLNVQEFSDSTQFNSISEGYFQATKATNDKYDLWLSDTYSNIKYYGDEYDNEFNSWIIVSNTQTYTSPSQLGNVDTVQGVINKLKSGESANISTRYFSDVGSKFPSSEEGVLNVIKGYESSHGTIVEWRSLSGGFATGQFNTGGSFAGWNIISGGTTTSKEVYTKKHSVSLNSLLAAIKLPDSSVHDHHIYFSCLNKTVSGSSVDWLFTQDADVYKFDLHFSNPELTNNNVDVTQLKQYGLTLYEYPAPEDTATGIFNIPKNIRLYYDKDNLIIYMYLISSNDTPIGKKIMSVSIRYEGDGIITESFKISGSTAWGQDTWNNMCTLDDLECPTIVSLTNNQSIQAVAGSNINSVGTPSVTTSTSDDGATMLTFNYLKGATGSSGTRGSMWYSGTAITGTSTTATVFSNSGISSALVNDMYINTSTQNLYKCTTAGNASAAKWVYTGCIKGANGTNGTTPTIKAAAGSNINTVGTPSVTASTSGTTTTFTFNNLKGAKGDKGDAGTQYAITTSTATENINREILVGTIDGHKVYQVTYKMGAQANSTGEKKSYKIGYPGNDVTMIEATGVINDGSVTFVVPFYKPDTGDYAYLGKYMSQMLVVSNMKTIKGALVTVRYIKNTDYLK
jgi:hypothetical protein